MLYLIVESTIMTKLFISAEVLEKMVCLTCKHYLSVFPISTKNDSSGAICGRCKVTDENKFIRDEAYEGIAQYLLFPCMHSSNGCKEHLTPPKLEEHEKCCPLRKFDCPSMSYSKCQWQGPRKEMVAHFQVKHPNLLLNTATFELSFLNSQEENLLLCKGEELFIVKKEIDSRKELFFCSVLHLKAKEDDETFNYFLKVESGNKNYFYRGPEKTTKEDESTKLTADFLREQLHDPASIVVNIEIVKPTKMQLDVSEQAKVAEEVKKNTNINWDLLSELECPVCYEYMLPPIFQCLNGHSICQTCKVLVTECPMCKNPVQDTQNFVLEKMTQYLDYPCKFHKMGCTFSCKSTEIQNHENGCEFGPFDCPLKEFFNCQWNSNSSEIVEHLENNHDEHILKTDKVDVPFNRDELNEKIYLIKFSKKCFKLLFKYNEERFYWVVQLVGPSNESKNYRFEVDIVDLSGNKRRYYLTGLVSPLAEKNDSFKNPNKYIMVTLEQVSGFIKNVLSFRMRIIKD
ncbi:hypothetical protein JTB14_016916 [Gonioctena quinquepunctata]|nr:hypothetical protein JTB14_016916 [Gonioctena quinquepunctata]